MRIALVCPYDWSAPGGVQVHVRELAEHLRERREDVLVVAPSSRPADEPGTAIVGSTVSIPYNGSVAPIDPRPWRVPEIRSALRRFTPDIVHVHEPLVPNTSMWATLASAAPVVATFHSGADRSRLFDLAAPGLRRVARRISARIAVSERAAAFVRARIPGPIETVPNGIDVGAYSTATPADLGPGRKMLFVGRLDPRKGFPVAIAAFATLAAERDDVSLVVVGAGTQRAALHELPPGVRDRVRLLGRIPNRALPPISRACDVFIAPSTGGESFGVILIEAMAAGLPIVASAIPGYTEVVEDGVTGLLVPPNDARALAAASARVLDDRALAARLAASVSERARRYDWSVVAAEVEAVYASVLGRVSADPEREPPEREPPVP